MTNGAMKLIQERATRILQAIALQTPDRVPNVPMLQGYVQNSSGSSYADLYYDHERAEKAELSFYSEYPMIDAHFFEGYKSGKANEIAGTTVMDWPGRPGTKISVTSSHQIMEKELMMDDEYPELLTDFTGFMQRKYYSRLYGNLSGLESLSIIPIKAMTAKLVMPYGTPEVVKATAKLQEIATLEYQAFQESLQTHMKLIGMGLPPFCMDAAEAPYDILCNYFRGSMGMFEDLTDEDMHSYIDQACDMFANMEIQYLVAKKDTQLPIKMVIFPLTRGCDNFMSDAQFRRFYWKPLRKVMMALIDARIIPYIFAEGSFATRLDYFTDVPKGKVFYSFENADMAAVKKKFEGIACIGGNLSITRLEYAKKEQIIDDTKRLLDVCMPGGGYIFTTSGALDNAKKENFDAMMEVVEQEGKY